MTGRADSGGSPDVIRPSRRARVATRRTGSRQGLIRSILGRAAKLPGVLGSAAGRCCAS